MKHHESNPPESRIPAIQTTYKGYRFRSRLEARFGIFFDALGLKWEYELEGFDLGDPFGRYLPDFYLPSWNMWVEIKPTITEFYWELTLAECKMQSLCTASRKNGAVLFGTPDVHLTHVSLFVEDSPAVSQLRHCRSSHLGIFQSPYFPLADGLDFWSACDAAKSARFEFGETPEPRP